MIELMISHGARAKNISEEILMFHRHIHYSNPTLLQYLFDNKVFESLEANDFAQQLKSLAVQCQPYAVDMFRVCLARGLHVGNTLNELISIVDDNGDSLLHQVVRGAGHYNFGRPPNYGIRPLMIQELIMHGANVLKKNVLGRTPEQLAILQNEPWRRTPDTIEMIPVLKRERDRLDMIQEQRRIAFAMGMHDRLGDRSKLKWLDEDLLRLIWQRRGLSSQ
jgi:hypothetical protein